MNASGWGSSCFGGTGSGRHRGLLLGIAAALLAVPLAAQALTVTGGTAAANNRFESGFPTAPVENSSGSFVGAGLDWSGVAWSTTAFEGIYKGFAMLSPLHFLAAQHYEYSGPVKNEFTTGVRVVGQDSMVHSQSKSTDVTNLGVGLWLQGVQGEESANYDLAMGTLDQPVTTPGNVARMGVLDLHNSSGSNTFTNYGSLSVLAYGRGASTDSSPRVGATTTNRMAQNGTDANQIFIETPNTDVQMQTGDSGSPLLHVWANPNGGSELSVLGVNSSLGPSEIYISAISTAGGIAAANTVMNQQGYALRVVGNSAKTWVGSSSTSIGDKGAWGIGPGPEQAPSDKFVLFDAATAGSGRVVTVDSNHNLRGLYFKSTAGAGDGFTFGGTSTLTVGRGGITNYDNDRQVFTAPLLLGSSQYWDGGAGGITVGALNTNGRLLEVTGSGLNRLTGVVSGTGGLAVSGGTLEVTGQNTYSGDTWVHGGVLAVNNIAGSGTGSGTVRVAQGGTLSGEGVVGGSAIIYGSVAPGNSLGTLTVTGDVTWHAGDAWLFELFEAADSLAASESGVSIQDQLLVGQNFVKGTGSVWTFDFAGTGELGWYELIGWSGGNDFAATDFEATNLAEDYTASFQIQSDALYVQVIPEPHSVLLLALAGLALGLRRFRRNVGL